MTKFLEFLTHPAVLAVLIPLVGGLLGTWLEAIGTRYNRPTLVAIGQRIEGLLADLPKLIRGSRKTAEDKAAAEPKDPPSEPPATRPSGRPPLIPVTAFFLLAGVYLFAPALPACSSGQTPQAQAAQARNVARAGYAAAAIALNTLNDVHHAWQVAQREPTQATIDLDEKLLIYLDAAKAALDTARPWLERGVAGDPAKEKIFEALDMATLAASVLAGAGGKVPNEVTEALMAARVLLGGAS